MPPRKKENEPKAVPQCDPKTCPVAGVLLDYFKGMYGNDAKPQVIKDLTALMGKE